MKKIIFSIGIFIALILMCNISNATTISVSPAEPKVGDTITVTVTVPNVHTSSVTANVSGVVSGTIKIVGGDLAGEVKSYSKSGTYTCSKEGTINIEISSDSSAVLNGQYVDVAAKKTVTVKAKPTTPPATTTQPETPTTSTTPEPAKKSTEARLSNFGIKPNDFSGFKRDKTEYSTEVPNSVTQVNVYATAVDSKAKISGTGNVTLKEGDNTIKVTVTAEAGNTKTYTLTIKRKTAAEEAENAGEARLKTLGIKPEEYDFSGFDSEKTEYSVEVPNEVEEIEIYATAMSSKAQITGTGMIELQEGKNELKVEVIAEDGTKKTYTLEVTRKESDEAEGIVEQFGLSTLLIQGITLNPSFKVGTYEYKVELNEDLSSLDIQAKANEKNATVEIIGNENLQQGENIITVLVKNNETQEVITYQIIVNKNLVAEEIIQTSWLKPSTWGKEEKIKIAIIIVLIILIIIAIILKIKIGKENNQDKEREFPGADELDKAIAEHQELSAEEERVGESNLEITQLEEFSNLEHEQNYIQEIAESRFGIEENQKDFEEVKPKRRGRHF